MQTPQITDSPENRALQGGCGFAAVRFLDSVVRGSEIDVLLSGFCTQGTAYVARATGGVGSLSAVFPGNALRCTLGSKP